MSHEGGQAQWDLRAAVAVGLCAAHIGPGFGWPRGHEAQGAGRHIAVRYAEECQYAVLRDATDRTRTRSDDRSALRLLLRHDRKARRQRGGTEPKHPLGQGSSVDHKYPLRRIVDTTIEKCGLVMADSFNRVMLCCN